jgi:hypothetical protein
MPDMEKKQVGIRESSVLTAQTLRPQEKQPGRIFLFGVPCPAVFAFSRRR